MNEPNYITEDTTHSVVEVTTKSTNDKSNLNIKNFNKTDNSGMFL